MKTYFTKLSLGLIIFASASFFTACKKTETIPAPLEEQNRMTSYQVVNVQGDPIIGAINDQDSTVTVYLPSYRQLTSLQAEISVSEGAVLEEDNLLIEDLMAVIQGETTVYYHVQAKEESTRRYKLVIIVQQEPLVLEEISPNAEAPQLYTLNLKNIFATLNFNINGIGFVSNYELMKVVLVNEAGQESTPLGISIMNTTNIRKIGVNLTYFNAPGQEIDPVFDWLTATGLYKIRVYNYAQVVTMQNPIQIDVLKN